jgi:hypothetical protein
LPIDDVLLPILAGTDQYEWMVSSKITGGPQSASISRTLWGVEGVAL